MKVFEKSKVSKYSTEELNEYRSSLKGLTDFINSINNAKDEGEIIGITKGKIEGKIEVALNAIKKGFDNQTIQDLTGLSAQEIVKIRKKNT